MTTADIETSLFKVTDCHKYDGCDMEWWSDWNGDVWCLRHGDEVLCMESASFDDPNRIRSINRWLEYFHGGK